MRIALFSETYWPVPDGVARFLYDFKKELLRMGDSVFVFTAAGDGDFTFPALHFVLYPQYKVAVMRTSFIEKVLRNYEVDIVHIHTPFSIGTAGYIAARRVGIPVIGTVHTNFLRMAESLQGSRYLYQFVKLLWKFSKKLYNRCDRVTAPTSLFSEELMKMGYKKVYPTPLGIDIDKFQKDVSYKDIINKYDIEEELVYLYLGRLTLDKGIHHLIRAFKIALSKIDACLLIGGKGPYFEKLVNLTNNLKIEKNVKFLGYVKEEDKPKLMKLSKAVILPSKADTLGIVLLEAMASGSIAIGANKGGIPEVIRDGETGFLFEYGDIDKLSKILVEVAKNDYGELKERAYHEVKKKYSIKACVERFKGHYLSLLR
ncbi:hypothetical protein B6U74_02590 [Candidatus Bathyarchaeota archaeon ex4484_205]|nr:MAG: hypothetical protein B6U74_02590 [Candidatus Bathyarchaeota archaeon ex4484_205]